VRSPAARRDALKAPHGEIRTQRRRIARLTGQIRDMETRVDRRRTALVARLDEEERLRIAAALPALEALLVDDD
jgi:hypothetical protein